MARMLAFAGLNIELSGDALPTARYAVHFGLSLESPEADQHSGTISVTVPFDGALTFEQIIDVAFASAADLLGNGDTQDNAELGLWKEKFRRQVSPQFHLNELVDD